MKNLDLLNKINNEIKDTFDLDLKKIKKVSYTKNDYYYYCCLKNFIILAKKNNIPTREISKFLNLVNNTVNYHYNTRTLLPREVKNYLKLIKPFIYEK